MTTPREAGSPPEANLDLSAHSELLHPSELAIATTTFYRGWYPGAEVAEQNTTDKVRGDLALEALKAATDRGYQVAVVDASDNPAFTAALEALGITAQPETEHSMSGSRRQVFGEASQLGGTEVICWVEPEKVSMVEQAATCTQPILDGEADIVVPKRGQAAFDTYPTQQARFEQRSNKLWNGVLRKAGLLHESVEDLDVWFGPRFFCNDPKILELFSRQYDFDKRELSLDNLVKPENYSNATFFPVIAALSEGFRVRSVDVHYRHPERQTAIEQGDAKSERKRVVQQRDIVVGAIHYIRRLLGQEKSRLRRT